MLTQETIERAKNTMRIEEVVGDYITLRRRGANLIGLCPFHEERTPSFNVSPPRGIYKCFGCGESGNAISFVMKMENCSFTDAVKKICGRYHLPVEERAMSEEDQQRHDDRESMFALNKWANEWFQEQLWNTPEGKAVGLAYFHERGLRDETIRTYGLGFSPEKGSPLTKAAQEAGFTEKYLVNVPDPQDMQKSMGTGLCCKSERDNRLFDRFSARVMFPIFSISGQVVGFAGRIMTDRKDVGKYVNSPESLIYSKRNELYGIFQAKNAISKQDMAYLVEGQMDVISMHQAGIENVLCSGGTALTEGHVRKIHRFTNNVTILYDGDAAGIHAALKAINMFLEEKMQVKVMLFPDGDDPDSFSRKHTAEEFRDFVRTHSMDFVQYMVEVGLNRAGNDNTRRMEEINVIIATIAIISNSVEQQLYTQELAAILGMKEDVVARSVAAARRKYVAEKKREQETEQLRQGQAAADSNVSVSPQETSTPSSIPSLVTPPTEPRKTTPPSTFDLKIQKNYRNIVQMIVRHGNAVYTEYDNGSFLPVGLFLIQSLRDDNMTPADPLIQKVFNEYEAHFADEDFDTAEFFAKHPDQQLATFAADLLIDEYTTGKTVQVDDNYAKQAFRLLNELKFNICDKRLRTELDMDFALRKALLEARAVFAKERNR
ncbi:MAG: DNA primase [Paludibacteraceae bacterium]|nr:DNA primase [Paludibacteraceae bacterium]